VRWISASARVGATQTGRIFAAALLDHYRHTLSEIRQVGYVGYAGRQLRPYLRACVNQFSPERSTVTQRVIEKLRHMRSPRDKRRDGA
jgi:hypothetical protein